MLFPYGSEKTPLTQQLRLYYYKVFKTSDGGLDSIIKRPQKNVYISIHNFSIHMLFSHQHLSLITDSIDRFIEEEGSYLLWFSNWYS